MNYFMPVALGVLASGLVTSGAAGQNRQGKPGPAGSAPAPDLPRILLIGDSISIGYTRAVRQLLQGRALVSRNPGNAAHSTKGAANVSKWLNASTGKWDVVHFNFGLHDLAYRNANGKGLVRFRNIRIRELP